MLGEAEKIQKIKKSQTQLSHFKKHCIIVFHDLLYKNHPPPGYSDKNARPFGQNDRNLFKEQANYDGMAFATQNANLSTTFEGSLCLINLRIAPAKL